MAGAPLNNNNAEKPWTFDEALELYARAFELSEEIETFIVNKEEVEGFKYDFIGEVVKTLRKEYKGKRTIYRKLLNTGLPEKFPDLKSQWEELKEDLETNCFSNTKKGIINTAAGIINLKSNHNWKDKQEIQNEHKGEIKIIREVKR